MESNMTFRLVEFGTTIVVWLLLAPALHLEFTWRLGVWTVVVIAVSHAFSEIRKRLEG